MERYDLEIKRVAGVIDTHLKSRKTEYLVGEKMTYVDLSFVPWIELVERIFMPEWDY
jgi:glutathione S-transferase